MRWKDKYKRSIFLRPRVFMCGAEEVEKAETERRPTAGGRRSSARSGLETEGFQLPQGHGETRQ